MRQVRTTRPRGQNWPTFLHNHAEQIWVCDFLPVIDLLFRSLFAFFIIELHSRKVIHVGVTRSPSDVWVAQQLREATAYGEEPKYLLRDNDRKFGVNFARVAGTSRIEILKTPYHAPRANAICERFLGSVCMTSLLRDRGCFPTSWTANRKDSRLPSEACIAERKESTVMEAVYYAARGNLRRLLRVYPSWTRAQLAQATGMSPGPVAQMEEAPGEYSCR